MLAGKQVGNTTARTEVRATGAGSGTFDETTDSVQAIRDRGDAAWVTGGDGPVDTQLGTMLVQIGTTGIYRFTSSSLINVPISPIGAGASGTTYDTEGGRIVNITVAQNATTTIPYSVTDANGAPIDVTGRELRYVVSDLDGVVLFTLSTADVDSAITVGGADGNYVQIEVGVDDTENPYAGVYKFWDYTNRDPLASGAFTISTSPI